MPGAFPDLVLAFQRDTDNGKLTNANAYNRSISVSGVLKQNVDAAHNAD